MASNLSFCPSATIPIIATTPDIGACVPSLMEVSVMPGDCAAAEPAAAAKLAANSSRPMFLFMRLLPSGLKLPAVRPVIGFGGARLGCFAYGDTREQCAARSAEKPDHAVARNQHHGDENGAIDQAGKSDVHVGGPVGQEHDKRRADEGAADAGDSADDRADQEIERLCHLERLGADIGVDDREQAAAEARQPRACG